MRNGDRISRARAEFNAGPADLVITLRDFDVGEPTVDNLGRERVPEYVQGPALAINHRRQEMVGRWPCDRRVVAPLYFNSRPPVRKATKRFAKIACRCRPELVLIAVNYPIGSRNRRP